MLKSDMNPVIVMSVSFSENAVEVTFFEKREQADRAGVIKTLVVQNDVIHDELEEVTELLQGIVDAGLLEIRNPPEHLDPRQRLAKTREDDVEAPSLDEPAVWEG